MGRFISNFATTSEYNSAQANLEEPHVSLTQDNMRVHFKPYNPYVGHEYVEIGGLKWATMNIGANSVTDYGLFFQWGDTQGYTADQVGEGSGQKYFGWADYKYNPSGDGETFTKYNSTDSKTVLDASDDSARANWGGSWRMPTAADFQVLGAATTSEWAADYEGSGVAGLVVTSNADSSKKLFFPAAGDCRSDYVDNVDSYGYYWSSSIFNYDMGNACELYFSSGDVSWDYDDFRYMGFTVRPVAN